MYLINKLQHRHAGLEVVFDLFTGQKYTIALCVCEYCVHGWKVQVEITVNTRPVNKLKTTPSPVSVSMVYLLYCILLLGNGGPTLPPVGLCTNCRPHLLSQSTWHKKTTLLTICRQVLKKNENRIDMFIKIIENVRFLHL